ncbi:hypothetical protein DFJ74DRAFT_711701 [Hyaloraphidium curvatum]|nr:hypothetical protein DFJ74DRAFT_711701 [Hyaloraphidium curvatum]
MQVHAPVLARPATETSGPRPSLLSALSLVRAGGDLFARAKLSAASPNSAQTAVPSPLSAFGEHGAFTRTLNAQGSFSLLDALTLKLKNGLAVGQSAAQDDRASGASIDLEGADEVEELHAAIVETVQEGRRALAEQELELGRTEDPELVKQLRAENEELASRLKELEAVAADYASVLDQLKAAQETVQRQGADLLALRSENDSQAAEVKRLMLLNHGLFLQNDAVNVALGAAQADVVALEANVRDLQATVEKQDEEKGRMEGELASQMDETARLRAQVDALAGELETERATHRTDERELAAYKDRIRSMEDEIRDLKQALQEQRDKDERRGFFSF